MTVRTVPGVTLSLWYCARLYARYDTDAVFGCGCDLTEVLKDFLASENSEAACCESFHFVLACHDFNRADE
jgi:hypothetical protein